MKKNLFVFLLLMSSSISFGQTHPVSSGPLSGTPPVPAYVERPADAAGIYTIYPGMGVPPGSENWTWQERTTAFQGDRMARNVVIPTVTVFKPAVGTANGTALIVAPGGAFHFMVMEKEGYTVTRWLAKQGITAFVLKYRVQHTPDNDAELQASLSNLFKDLPKVSAQETYPPMSHPGAEEARLWGEEDARQAIRFIRQHANEQGIAPNRIGTMGFSAGGGISVNAALQHDALSRPDFVGAIYAGYRIVSPLPDDLPPLFIAIADDDKSVAPISSARLYEDWHKKGKPVELHIFGSGDHGFGMLQQNKLTDSWIGLFKNWLHAQGFLTPAPK